MYLEYSGGLNRHRDTMTDYSRIVGLQGDVNKIGSVTAANVVSVDERNFKETLGGEIDSSKLYLVDGKIDIKETKISVPLNGLSIVGLNSSVSGLYSSVEDFVMFESVVAGSGDVNIIDLELSTTGLNSKVFQLKDNDGSHYFEVNRVKFTNCKNLGEIEGYKQGLEISTIRRGGMPNLKFSGTFQCGYRVIAGLVRDLSSMTSGALFEEGANLVFESRFFTDINADLPMSSALCNFTSSNFPNASTFQIMDAIITRDGMQNANDSNISPNLAHGHIASFWRDNQGVHNTYIGGKATVTTEKVTNLSADTWGELDGVFESANLQHFKFSSIARLENEGNNPREFRVTTNFVIECTANDSVSVMLRKFDKKNSVLVDLTHTIQTRQINSLVGQRDVGFFNGSFLVELEKGDYIFPVVRNNGANNNVTAEKDSFFMIEAR